MSETAIDRLYDALGRGDIEGMRAACTPDARFWHSFDGIAHDLDGAAKDWTDLVANSIKRGLADIRCQPIEGGLLQQHLFVLETAGGRRVAWPVCLVVRIEGDRIARIEEYIDRAGSFTPTGEEPVTPGF